MITTDEIKISANTPNIGMTDFESSISEDRKVIDEVAKAISEFAQDENMTRAQVINMIAQSSSMSVRTLEKFFSKKGDVFKPHVRIIEGVFSQVLKADSYTDLLLKSSPIIKNFLTKNHSGLKKKNSSDFSTNLSQETALTRSSLFNEIYMMSSGEHGTDKVSILELYGSKGLMALDSLLNNGYVIINSDERIIRGKRLSWNYPIRHNFISTLVDLYNEEMLLLENQALLSVTHGEVTTEDYKEIRKILTKCHDDISLIIDKSKPTLNNTVKVASASILQEIGPKSLGSDL